MKKAIFSLLLCLPMAATAEFLDIIDLKLADDCTFGQLLQITNDFNTWGDENGYHARLAMPVQSADLDMVYWVGTAANAEAFGKAWDTWRDALGDPESAPAKLWVRLQACSENIKRTGYDLY